MKVITKEDFRIFIKEKLKDVDFIKSSEKINENLSKHFFFNKRFIVAGYYPRSDEISVLPFLKMCFLKGYKTCLPIIQKNNNLLTFIMWKYGDPLKQGIYNIPEPTSFTAVIPDIILIPLMACDSKGYRLGKGKGYYDRTICFLSTQKKIVTIGIAVEQQIFRQLPIEEHDQKLDYIVTEERIISF